MSCPCVLSCAWPLELWDSWKGDFGCVGFGYFVFSETFLDHFPNRRLDFLYWGFVFFGKELHGLKAKPYGLTRILSVCRLEVVFCFLLLFE